MKHSQQSKEPVMRSAITRCALAGMVATLALTAAGCGGGSPKSAVASVSSKPSGGSSQTASASQADPLKYAQCMRSNGVANFPDPKANQSLQLPNGVDPNSSQFKAAQEACKAYMPAGPASKSGGSDPWPAAQKLKYSQCMRANGVSNFPDPDKNGGFSLQQGSGVDPQSQAFQTAAKACAKYQPQGVQPNAQPGGN
jgi:hypothetical protein